MGDEVLFKSKEYGVGGHNKLELRTLDDGGVRLWIHDGDCHALICMDRDDLTEVAKQLRKAAKTAPETIELMDFTQPIKHAKVKKLETTSSVVTKRPRKTRSDKGKPRKKNG